MIKKLLLFFIGLLSSLYQGTDLVPSDIVAGCILLRIRQKRETRELRRLNILPAPKYTSGIYFNYYNSPPKFSNIFLNFNLREFV